MKFPDFHARLPYRLGYVAGCYTDRPVRMTRNRRYGSWILQYKLGWLNGREMRRRCGP